MKMFEQTKIQKFYEEKTVFLTGGTGYVGTALIEKLLRSCGRLRRIYTVVRDKQKVDKDNRYEDWCRSIVFNNIRENDPAALKKVVFLKGDLQVARLGLSDEDFETVIEEVNCVFHVGASVKFVDHLSNLLQKNLFGTDETIKIVKKIKNLQAFVHVSTGYAQCNKSTIEEIMYESEFSSETMLVLLKTLSNDKLNEMAPTISNDFPNNYTFSKFLAEDLVRRTACDLPVAVVRPTIIAPALKEPLPGWTNRFQSYSALIASYGMGFTNVLPTSPNVAMDVIPLEHTVNLVIAAAWDLGSCPNRPKKSVKVYNCASSHQNPLPFGKFENLLHEYDAQIPSNKKFWHRFVIFTQNVVIKTLMFAFHLPSIIFLDFFSVLMRKPRSYLKLYKEIHFLMQINEHFMRNAWLFKTDNTQRLCRQLEGDDKKIFDFEVSLIDWNMAIYTFISGIRLYVLKENLDTLSRARIRRKALKVLHYVTVCFYLCAFFIVVKMLFSCCL